MSGRVLWGLIVSISVMASSAAQSHNQYHLAKDIFANLGIKPVTVLSEGHYFGLPQIVWGFQQTQGFAALLRRLEKKPAPFEQIEVWQGQFLLSGMHLNPANEPSTVQLWVKRHQDDAFSGTLSLWGATSAETLLPSLNPLPVNTRVLLDISTEQPTKARQWIYLLPFTPIETQQWLTELLQQQQWQSVVSEGVIQLWQRSTEQLQYHLSEEEGQTALYVLKKQR